METSAKNIKSASLAKSLCAVEDVYDAAQVLNWPGCNCIYKEWPVTRSKHVESWTVLVDCEIVVLVEPPNATFPKEILDYANSPNFRSWRCSPDAYSGVWIK
jgi:hypothetical protein